MRNSGALDRAVGYLNDTGCVVMVWSGIGKNPTFREVEEGLAAMQEFQPDVVVAIGGGSAMDAAKGMLLFYEFPQLKLETVLEQNQKGLIPAERRTGLVCIPSTSGTGSEVTRGTVLTDTAKQLKVPIMTDCLRPDIAILDAELTITMPLRVAAETGMDALTHAIEAYTNHNLDDFDEGLCKSAMEGILKWLPVSCKAATLESREKVHNFQAMAGIGFANVGLGMVHGIAHAYGAIFNLDHGLTNAIILPYVLEYNRRDASVGEKLKRLSYHCECEDIVTRIRDMRRELNIAACFAETGMTRDQFEEKFDLLLDHSMLGATKVNPVKMTPEAMEKMIRTVYYGTEIDF